MKNRGLANIREWYKEEENAVFNGLSKWTSIVFKWVKNNQEFYRVERDPEEMKTKPDQFVTRREYFNGKLKRTYEGWENSFIEFIDLMDKHNTSPDQVDLGFYAMYMPLKMHERWLYTKYYLELFGPKKVPKGEHKKVSKKTSKKLKRK
jgi:hypothetical protein